MLPPWATILISFGSAILTALITPFATSRWQQRNWQRQRLADVRFTVITEVNRLAAEFETTYLFKDVVETTYESGLMFAQAWMAVTAQVKDLFSPSTYEAFERMFRHIITAPLFSTQDIRNRVPRLTEFTKVRETAMRALYIEIGILKGETKWSRFKRRFKK